MTSTTTTTTDLDDLLADLADIDDTGIRFIVAGLRNIADRARAGALTRDRTQLLCTVLAASPEATDVLGAIGLTIAQITNTTTPALHQLTDEARKTAAYYGEEAAFRLNDDELRQPASEACAALDNTQNRKDTQCA
jgi:hypothetical protein